ncbi:FAD-binding oxidoreductase [Agromyces indicus]|uniref:FAD-linked oxidase C-terminal domain-containing protein n=1 Tax=Agromyces indicus TaxID=758919 RepID=A0ABU1FN19_9MICO|nr:FAD-linked oxidase C-terminal domain-containing protein [Agromyces indicus]MDR5693139.1 FAD-linked oxidase C-terminal domain-containing protein [Agromyces indicus]
MHDDVLTRLTAALGDAVVTSGPALDAVREDRSGWVSEHPALAVVHAASVDDVQQVLRLANETRTPVVPRGAGTGLAGGALASRGAIVLDLTRMNRILELDDVDELAVVEAGVLNGDLDRAARERGLWYAPDPASRAISSIGGNIATNAGGLLCAKYGVTRESVLGLAVVLADGTLLRTGHRTVKGVTGYDLTALLTGSEGTLGVIVEATVRLRPVVAGETHTVAAAFPDVEAAGVAAAGVAAARIRPALLELIDAVGLGRVAEFLGPDELAGTPIADLAPGETFLLAQTDAGDAAAEADVIARVFAEAGGRVTRSTDAATGERLLGIRRAMHPALASRGKVLIEDVAVPRSRLPQMFRAIAEIGERYGVEIPTLAHAGDGNLHPNFVFEGDDVPDHVWAAADEMFRAAVRLGGTLTGEHGVGLLKRRWLAEELGDASVELQRRIKQVFDPAGLLNPGVMFEPAPGTAR